MNSLREVLFMAVLVTEGRLSLYEPYEPYKPYKLYEPNDLIHGDK